MIELRPNDGTKLAVVNILKNRLEYVILKMESVLKDLRLYVEVTLFYWKKIKDSPLSSSS